MNLPAALWGALGLEPAVVQRRAQFFASYATLDEPRYDVRDLVRLLRQGPITDGAASVVDLLGPADAATALRRTLESLGPAEPQAPWIRVAEMADAWRQSAIAQLLYDTLAGKQALLRAARMYRRLGLPFGAFLTAAATGSREAALVANDWLDFMLDPELSPETPEVEGLIGWRAALQAPAQQVSVLITALSDPSAVTRPGYLAERLATAPQANGSVPVGTTAQPVALWWAAGRQLAALAGSHQNSRSDLASSLAALADAHGRQLRYAQFDQYHWAGPGGRVDLVDLDLAGLVAISARALRRLDQPSWSLPEEFHSLPPLASISVTIGLQLAEESGPFDGQGIGSGPPAPDPSPEPLNWPGTTTERTS